VGTFSSRSGYHSDARLRFTKKFTETVRSRSNYARRPDAGFRQRMPDCRCSLLGAAALLIDLRLRLSGAR
jgi:hypothetical protein